MLLELKNISYTYKNAGNTSYALNNVSMCINAGEFIGITGHTGSGKSTLAMHMNGLIKADAGNIHFKGKNIYGRGYKLSEMRKSVGLVFQYPEYQLFKQTVIEDVSFGPMNKYKDGQKAKEAAEDALRQTGIADEMFDKYPLSLSGGEKRRIAIAGVIAMNPEIIILDEPTAGLDPAGKKEIFAILKKLRADRNMAVVIVSHSMEDMAEYVDRMIVMNNGSIKYDGTPKAVFRNYAELERMGLSAPQVTYLQEKLRAYGMDAGNDGDIITTVDEAVDVCEKILTGGPEDA